MMQRCLGCMREFDDALDTCPHCGYVRGTPAKQINYLPPGTVLQRRYILGKALGQGGFGITYIAWDSRMERALAIKEYMPNALATRTQDQKTVSCFSDESARQFYSGLQKVLRESRTLAQFTEMESVVKVLDCIEENGTAYIIMELLRGETVRDILARETRLPFERALQIITPVLQTLDAIHQTGLVHRDVAPDNIFVCTNGTVKLLDFGAARITIDADDKTLSVILKQGYAPIEQYSNHGRQGPFTDVYASAATLYKMLTGVTPPASLDRMSGVPLEPIAQYASVPPYVQQAIERGMAVDASVRTQSASALLRELTGLSAGTSPLGVYAGPQYFGQTMPLGVQVAPRQNDAPITGNPSVQPVPSFNAGEATMAVHSGQYFSSDEATQAAPSVLPSGAAQDQPRPKPEKKNGKMIAVIAAAAVVLVVLGVLLGKVLSTPEAETTTPAAETTSAAATSTAQATQTTETTRAAADPNRRIPIAYTSCSTDQGAGKYGRNYHADNVADGDFNTCWMAAGDYAGSGTWVQISFDSEQTVSGIELLNGNGWNGYYQGEKVENGLYDLNGRIRDFTLEFSDGSTRRYTAQDVREESFGKNIFVFSEPVKTQYIRLHVDSGYPGSKWTSVVCLSEFAAF